MKKILLIIMSAISGILILMSGICTAVQLFGVSLPGVGSVSAGAGSIGIIGGADGPTATFVAGRVNGGMGFSWMAVLYAATVISILITAVLLVVYIVGRQREE